MSSYAPEIVESEERLRVVQAELEEIEAMKAKEPKLRREEASLVAKIADLKEAMVFYERVDPTPPEEEPAPDAKAQPKKQAEAPKGPTAPVQRDPESERKAKMRALNKKLQQIEKLKLKEDLDQDARNKIKDEPNIRKKLEALARGEDLVEEEEEEQAPTAAKEEPVEESEDGEDDKAMTLKLPVDAAEVEKRMRTLKKKLQQIAKLKEKGQLDADAAQKIASEYRLHQELEALEQGKDEVTFVKPREPTEEEAKLELEKKLKVLKKKLDQIKTLKAKDGDLDADARAKVESEAALIREANALHVKIAEYDKDERARVAERLGWEDEAQQNEEEKKKAKKSKAKASASKS